MNEKFQELIGLIKKKFGRKPPEDTGLDLDNKAGEGGDAPKEEPEANRSMIRGDHGKIMGIDRKIVKTIGIGGVLIFVFAFLFASGDSDSQKQNAQDQSDKQSKIATSQGLTRGEDGQLADDYGELARANQQKLNKNSQNATTVQAQRTGTTPTAAGANGNPSGSSTTLPAVPRTSSTIVSTAPVPQTPASYSAAYSLPSNPVPTPTHDTDDDEDTPAQPRASSQPSQQEKEKYNAAIAFFSGQGETGKENGDATSGNAAYTAPSATTVTAGTLIPAMLMTGINTDTPGQAVAQTLSDVYNTAGTTVLIPAGSRVLGTVSTADGASGRVNVTFSTLVLPDGGSYAIGDSLTAVDGAGYAGIAGNLHRHTGSNFMKGIFNSALTALSTAAVDRVTIDSSALTALTDTQKPTTTVEPGYTFNLYVTNNIAF